MKQLGTLFGRAGPALALGAMLGAFACSVAAAPPEILSAAGDCVYRALNGPHSAKIEQWAVDGRKAATQASFEDISIEQMIYAPSAQRLLVQYSEPTDEQSYLLVLERDLREVYRASLDSDCALASAPQTQLAYLIGESWPCPCSVVRAADDHVRDLSLLLAPVKRSEAWVVGAQGECVWFVFSNGAQSFISKIDVSLGTVVARGVLREPLGDKRIIGGIATGFGQIVIGYNSASGDSSSVVILDPTTGAVADRLQWGVPLRALCPLEAGAIAFCANGDLLPLRVAPSSLATGPRTSTNWEPRGPVRFSSDKDSRAGLLTSYVQAMDRPEHSVFYATIVVRTQGDSLVVQRLENESALVGGKLVTWDRGSQSPKAVALVGAGQ